MIRLQIVGNLGADCIQKEVNGKNVINFNVAHTEKFKDAQGNLKEKTIWANCAYWTDRTALAQYLKKGKQVFVDGSPEIEMYTNKDGQPAATLRVRVRDLQLLGGNIDGSQGNSNASNYASNSSSSSSPSNTSSNNTRVTADMEEAADDLPF
ncbi:MAG: single-stranded DNA-binding protein [Ginsengibacter sp.]